MFEQEENESVGAYWPSVTDLFMTLFIIAIVILGAVFFVLLPKNDIDGDGGLKLAVGENLNNIIKPVNKLRKEIGLEPVTYREASQVIGDLDKTCDAAIELLRELKKNDPDGMAVRIRQLEAQVNELNELVRQLHKQIQKMPGDSVAELQKRIKELEEINNTLLRENNNLKREVDELKRENTELKQESRTFVIDEGHIRFDSGSQEIKQDFSAALRESVGERIAPFPDFAARIINNPGRYDTLEIIGHTDGVPLSRTGNLDQLLPSYLAGVPTGSRTLTAGSNNDLGLLRALSLKQQWTDYVESYKPEEKRDILRGVKIRSYSAGQTILPVHIDNPMPADFRKNDPRARRIEMRLTKLDKGASN